MSLMRPVMGFPTKYPRWATDSGRTLDPDDTSVDLKCDKDVGWSVDRRPPARVMNWIHNLTYQWTKMIPRSYLSNWVDNSDIAADDVMSAIYHPDKGFWIAVTDNGTNGAYRSADGHTWAATAGAFNYTAVPNSSGIDATGRYIFAIDDGGPTVGLVYTANSGASWTLVPFATIGAGGAIGTGGQYKAFCTKYSASDFIVTPFNATGVSDIGIIYSSAVNSGVWTDATTIPTGLPSTSTEAIELIFVDNSTWLLLVGRAGGYGEETQLWVSSDDADNWTQETGLSMTTGAEGGKCMAWNPTLASDESYGRLVVGGSNSTPTDTLHIRYSDDLGATWSTATINTDGRVVASAWVSSMYYCGGQCWVAGVDPYVITSPSNQTILVSYDNAETWDLVDVRKATPASGGVNIFACDGRSIMAFGEAGFNLKSLSL